MVILKKLVVRPTYNGGDIGTSSPVLDGIGVFRLEKSCVVAWTHGSEGLPPNDSGARSMSREPQQQPNHAKI